MLYFCQIYYKSSNMLYNILHITQLVLIKAYLCAYKKNSYENIFIFIIVSIQFGIM